MRQEATQLGSAGTGRKILRWGVALSLLIPVAVNSCLIVLFKYGYLGRVGVVGEFVGGVERAVVTRSLTVAACWVLYLSWDSGMGVHIVSARLG